MNFVEKNELESTKEPEDYNKFLYCEEPITLPEQQCINLEQQNVATDGQNVVTDGQDNDQENVQGNEEQNEDQNNDQADRQRTIPVLARYVRRNHPEIQIIGDKKAGTRTK